MQRVTGISTQETKVFSPLDTVNSPHEASRGTKTLECPCNNYARRGLCFSKERGSSPSDDGRLGMHAGRNALTSRHLMLQDTLQCGNCAIACQKPWTQSAAVVLRVRDRWSFEKAEVAEI